MIVKCIAVNERSLLQYDWFFSSPQLEGNITIAGYSRQGKPNSFLAYARIEPPDVSPPGQAMELHTPSEAPQKHNRQGSAMYRLPTCLSVNLPLTVGPLGITGRGTHKPRRRICALQRRAFRIGNGRPDDRVLVAHAIFLLVRLIMKKEHYHVAK